MPIMQIEILQVEALIPYARNSRTHSDEQVAQIAASVREFGFTNPVLIDDQEGIIAGHGRVLAARKLQMTEVPCLRLSHLSEAQKRAYIIADNKLALNAGWDEELLQLELNDLHLEEFDMALLGISAQELSLAMGLEDDLSAPESSAKEIDPDDYQMGHTCPKCGFEFDAKT
jgi:ParB-like chromosome segregation protein Spo0J